jgi:RecJ-like exonuclease
VSKDVVWEVMGMAICTKCGGKGQVYNEEWDREWDRLDQKFPAHDIVNREIEKSGIPKYIACNMCNGQGEV